MHAARWAKLRPLLAALILCYPAFASTGVSLVVSTPNGQMKFQQGELIPLDLAFTATTSNRFSINMATYDRSGRMAYETIDVTPAGGTTDPLAVYFKAFRGFLGGGLTSYEYLSSKPVIVHLELNEWTRFDRPGVYRVSVISNRIADQVEENHGPQPLELRSNELTLQIVVADPVWQRKELTRIKAALEQYPPAGLIPASAARTGALKRLRYLGSADAAREMVRLFRSQDNQTEFECTFGLVGSPNRRDGLEEMQRLLAAPDFPVSEAFLSAMSLLSLDPNLPNESTAKEREENLARLREELLRVLPTKTGSAFAVSAAAALSGNQNQLSSDTRQAIARKLIESFRALPVETKIKWLQWCWDDVKGTQWIPLLRQLATEYTDFPVPNETHAYQSLQVTAAALTNWYNLDPEGARSAVIAEIERPKPRFGPELLGMLPDKTLPESQQIIAQHFMAASDYTIEANLAGLLFRYADADVLPVVFVKIQRSVGKWACAPQKYAFAYVLKVDENAAAPLIERALSDREQTGCWHTVLTDVGEIQQSPLLEDQALKALSGGDVELATDAARYLGEYGSTSAESALWERYTGWSQQWKGRDAELTFTLLGPQTHVWDANLGQALAIALATGQNWFADPARLQQIGSLGTESIRQMVKGYFAQASQKPQRINYAGSTPPQFQVGQYQARSITEIEKKLLQYPKDTPFEFSGSAPGNDAQVIADLKKWAQEKDIRISGLRVVP